MPITGNPTYSTGDTIEAVIVNNLRDDDLVLDARTGGDPGGAGKILRSSGALSGAWVDTIPATNLAAGAAVSSLGYTPLNKAGDTVSAELTAPSFRINSGASFWTFIASGASAFIGIPAVANPIEVTASLVKLSGTVTANTHQVVDVSLTDIIDEPMLDVTNTPTDGQALTWNGTAGRFEWSTLAAVAGVPSGLVASVRTAAEIPSGWARETALNNRFMVGATAGSAVFGAEFTEAQDYGSSWVHKHTGCSYSASVSGSATGGPEDSTGTPNGINGLATAGGVNLPTTSHTHSLDGVSFAVSATGSATGDTTDAAWVIPSRAYVYVRKS